MLRVKVHAMQSVVRAPRVPVVVAGSEVVLRPWQDSDVEAIAVVAKDPEIAVWNPFTRSPQDWIASRADWSEGDHASWAISPEATSSVVWGSISLFSIDADQAQAEIGFWIAPEFRRRGLATSALRLACTYAFEQLGLRRVVLIHGVENEGSCHTALSAGFAHEGTHRLSYRYGDGQFHDEHSHARLRAD